MSYRRGLAVTDDHIGPTFENRPDQIWNRLAAVLVVTVCIDNVVSTQTQTGVYSCPERRRKTPVTSKGDAMIYTQLLSHLDGPVGGTVIDD